MVGRGVDTTLARHIDKVKVNHRKTRSQIQTENPCLRWQVTVLTSTLSRWPSVFTAARERLAYLSPTLLTQWSVSGIHG